jgi:hypothetical protein
MCISSYASIVFSAPCTDRKPRLDSILNEAVVLLDDVVQNRDIAGTGTVGPVLRCDRTDTR